MIIQAYRKLRSQSISMGTKIMVMLTLAISVGLGVSGFLIYEGLRDRTYENAGDALLQTAASTAVGLDSQGLEKVRGHNDVHLAVYRHMRRSLRQVYDQSHFEQENRSTRLTLLRAEPGKRALVQVLSLEDDQVGRVHNFPEAVYKVLLRREPLLLPLDAGETDWMVAYAPLRRGASPYDYVLKLERNTAPLKRQMMGHIGTILLGALTGLILALLGGWFVTLQITNPLRNFVDVMRLMHTTGDFGMRIDLHPEDKDMSVVEKTFQSLVARMRDSRDREEQSYWSTLQALVTALDVRDNETAGHSLRVTRYSLAIGERLRLKQETMEQLRQGALLHDIGKIGVPDSVLRKAGKLAPAEWDEMRKHPAIGRTFLEDITFLRPAMAVVYCHHERWDGQGYPQGLSSDAIPIAARIFAVADALDAITSQRYYKSARSFREAQAEIESCAGTHFDPAVVKAFLTIPEKVIVRIRTETSMAGVELERLRKSAS